ncbi:hypothetical protein CI238_03206, partial [Colletotrichum incanum]
HGQDRRPSETGTGQHATRHGTTRQHVVKTTQHSTAQRNFHDGYRMDMVGERLGRADASDSATKQGQAKHKAWQPFPFSSNRAASQNRPSLPAQPWQSADKLLVASLGFARCKARLCPHPTCHPLTRPLACSSTRPPPPPPPPPPPSSSPPPPPGISLHHHRIRNLTRDTRLKSTLLHVPPTLLTYLRPPVAPHPASITGHVPFYVRNSPRKTQVILDRSQFLSFLDRTLDSHQRMTAVFAFTLNSTGIHITLIFQTLGH